MTEVNDATYLTVFEYAAKNHVTDQAVYQKIYRDQIKAIRINNTLLIAEDEPWVVKKAPPGYLNTVEYANKHGRTRQEVWQYIVRHKIPAVKIEGRYYIDGDTECPPRRKLSTGDKRFCSAGASLTEEELDILKQNAKDAGVTMSEYIRRRCIYDVVVKDQKNCKGGD